MTQSSYLRLRQICLVASDLKKAEDDIQAVLGCPPCFHDPAVGKYGLENTLFPLGDKFLEVVVPVQAGTAAHRFLEKSGSRGGYMVIMDCSDVDRRRAHVEKLGISIVNTAEYDGFKLVQMHPRECRGAILEFNHTVAGEATSGPYHPAGPDWPRQARNPVTAKLRQVTVETETPDDLASHCATIIERPVTRNYEPTIEFDDCRVVFSRSEAGERLIGLDIEIADPERGMAAAAERGLLNERGALWLCGVWVRLGPLTTTAAKSSSPKRNEA